MKAPESRFRNDTGIPPPPGVAPTNRGEQELVSRQVRQWQR
jgi:hypothetical protein